MSTKSHDASQVEICSNVSNTTGSLINLRVNETYAVTVQMCTRVGCGPTSQAIYIPAEETEPGSFTLTKNPRVFPMSQKTERSGFFQGQRNIRTFVLGQGKCKFYLKIREM